MGMTYIIIVDFVVWLIENIICLCSNMVTNLFLQEAKLCITNFIFNTYHNLYKKNLYKIHIYLYT